MKRLVYATGGKIWSSIITGDIKTKLLFIVGIVLLIIAIGMGVAFLIFNLTPGEALWWSWTHILDPGSLGDDKDVLSRRILGSIFAIAGLVLLGGAFITLSEEAARSAMDRLMQGNVPKGISGHTIIAGKGSKLKAFTESIKKLSTWQDGEKILIVSPDQEALLQSRKELGHDRNIFFVVEQVWEDGENRLKVEKAKRILLLDNFGGDTGAMLKAILKIQKLRKDENITDKLTLYAEVNDRILANGLRMSINEIENNDPSIDIHVLNISDASARYALKQYPLDCNPEKGNSQLITLIIEGWTQFAQALFWQAIRVAHYPSKPTKLILVHPDEKIIADEVWVTAPGLQDKWCKQNLVDIRFIKSLSQQDLGTEENNIVTIAVCVDDADKSFSRALYYREAKISGLKQIFIELPDTSGYRDVLKHMTSSGKIPLCPVGASAEAFELTEELDVLAEKIHSHYQKKYNDVEWSKLDEIKRVWNRSPADHIYVKLRILSAMIEKTGEKIEALVSRLAGYPENQEKNLDEYINMLSRIEHDRWCAEKYADGWTYANGPKNNAKKQNPCLIPYDNLPDNEKLKDWETMKVILYHIKTSPDILKAGKT